MSDNEENQAAPFMVKAMPIAARKAARAAASRAGLTMGPWIANAVYTQSQLEAGNAVMPPANPTRSESPIAAPTLSVADLHDLALAAAAVAQASGRPMPQRTAGRFYRLVDDKLRAATGLPPRQTRKTSLRGAAVPALESPDPASLLDAAE